MKVEKYEPVVVGGKLNNQSQEPLPITKQLSSPVPLTDQHNLPIAVMGDIEAYLRQKYRTEGSGCTAQYLRNPKLTDDENFALMKPYCGNPFIAPGELGSLCQHQPSFAASFTDEGFFMDEETVMP